MWRSRRGVRAWRPPGGRCGVCARCACWVRCARVERHRVRQRPPGGLRGGRLALADLSRTSRGPQGGV
eukprot:1226428-Prymnesium_polylepis.2